MRTWWKSVAEKPVSTAVAIEDVRRAEREYAALDDAQLRQLVKIANEFAGSPAWMTCGAGCCTADNF